MYIYRHYELPAIYLWPERPVAEPNERNGGRRMGAPSGANDEGALISIKGAQAMGLPIPPPDRWIKVSVKEEEKGGV